MIHTVILMVSMAFSAQTELDTEKKAFLNSIAIIYNSNRQASNSIVLKFKCAIGLGDFGEISKENTWSSACIGNGMFLRYEQNAKYTLQFLPSSPEDRQIPFNIKTYKNNQKNIFMITNGQESLEFHDPSPLDASAVGIVPVGLATSSGETFYKQFSLPNFIGNPMQNSYNLAADINTIINTDKYNNVVIIKNVMLDEEECVYLSFLIVPSNVKREYWICLKKGAIPLKIFDQYVNDKNHNRQIVNSQLKYTNDKAWIPFRYLNFASPNRCKEVILTEVDLTSIPAHKDFSLVFDKPRVVSKNIDDKTGLRLKEKKIWSLNDLSRNTSSPESHIINVRPLTVKPAFVTTEVEKKDRRFSNFAWGMGCMALIMAVILGIRKFRK